MRLAASEKYNDEELAGAKQSLRVKGGVDDDGVLQFHDYDFDFSAEGLEKLATTDPKVYGMYLASRSYILQQPGFVMHQRDVRPCKNAKPIAQVLTTSVNLLAAKEKDARKKVTTTKKKMTALATIGRELGKVVNIDEVDLIGEPTRKERNVYCQYCKRTLTRACNLAACKVKAKGDGEKAAQRKRKRGKDEWTSDAEDSDADYGELESDASSSCGDVPEIVTPGDVEPWIKDPKGKQAIVQFFNTMLLTDDLTHDRIPAKVTRYYLYKKKFNILTWNGNSKCLPCEKSTRQLKRPETHCSSCFACQSFSICLFHLNARRIICHLRLKRNLTLILHKLKLTATYLCIRLRLLTLQINMLYGRYICVYS